MENIFRLYEKSAAGISASIAAYESELNDEKEILVAIIDDEQTDDAIRLLALERLGGLLGYAQARLNKN